MTYLERKRVIEHLKWLCEQKNTGTPASLSKRWGVSQRTIRRFIESIELEFDVSIMYCRNDQTYKIIS